MNDVNHIIDAFADGERVDPDRLERALADAGGRAYLIDLLMLRGMVGEQIALAAALPAATMPVGAPRRVRGLVAIAASVLLLASGLSGFVAGHRAAARLAVVPELPVAAPEPVVLPDTQISAPAPTRVIQVEPGVDWKRSAGGN
jgi:hypothetical protein